MPDERFVTIMDVAPEDRKDYAQKARAEWADKIADRKRFLQSGPMIELHIRAYDDLDCWTKRRAYSVPCVGDHVQFISDVNQTFVAGRVQSVSWRYEEDEITVATVLVASS